MTGSEWRQLADPVSLSFPAALVRWRSHVCVCTIDLCACRVIAVVDSSGHPSLGGSLLGARAPAGPPTRRMCQRGSDAVAGRVERKHRR